LFICIDVYRIKDYINFFPLPTHNLENGNTLKLNNVSMQQLWSSIITSQWNVIILMFGVSFSHVIMWPFCKSNSNGGSKCHNFIQILMYNVTIGATLQCCCNLYVDDSCESYGQLLNYNNEFLVNPFSVGNW
jgi:hypothetical protein